jgi:hypothetical protein
MSAVYDVQDGSGFSGNPMVCSPGLPKESRRASNSSAFDP